MRQRVITAVIALIIFIPIVLIGGITFDIMAIVLGLVGISEIFIMRKKIIVSLEALLGAIAVLVIMVPNTWLPAGTNRLFIFYLVIMLMLVHMVFSKNRVNFDDVGVTGIAAVYIGLGFHYFIAARQESLMMLFYILFTIWATDIGAYQIGRKLGKHKLAPQVSPNKTWEGSIGGTLCAVIIGGVFVAFVPEIQLYSLPTMIFFTFIFSICGQLGDLVESSYKRHYGVKDSGKILPGHGGILDRFDSLLFVLPILHLFTLI
ncbi:phosphatidate cytidylyltransferase [Loigolactobacillus jiayinensis]|uniref:Phosphatidate cytidylyltransferase n=1 Tax=Loigolactobacillus jiayinensis TaxID=2486016 RepID=A0ABW1RB29_9LACO|nr:phosphatidate cytidylyltransferase [Loigolactobacillus jiayinensis]